MFYSCEGFSTEALKQYQLTTQDAHILRWFSQFVHSGQMETIIYRNKPYYKLKYEKVLKDLILLDFRSKRHCQRRFDFYCAQGLLEKRVARDPGDKRGRQAAFFRILPKFYELSAKVLKVNKLVTLSDKLNKNNTL